MPVTSILQDLFIIVLAAKIAAELFERVHQPPVIGELLAGVLVGPYVLSLIGTPDQGLVDAFHGDAALAHEALDLVYELFAEFGVVVLLFFVGPETRFSDILQVGRRAGGVALLGVVVPFALGYGFIGAVLRQPTVEAVFVGAAMVATSVGITARVLRVMGLALGVTVLALVGKLAGCGLAMLGSTVTSSQSSSSSRMRSPAKERAECEASSGTAAIVGTAVQLTRVEMQMFEMRGAA